MANIADGTVAPCRVAICGGSVWSYMDSGRVVAERLCVKGRRVVTHRILVALREESARFPGRDKWRAGVAVHGRPARRGKAAAGGGPVRPTQEDVSGGPARPYVNSRRVVAKRPYAEICHVGALSTLH